MEKARPFSQTILWDSYQRMEVRRSVKRFVPKFKFFGKNIISSVFFMEFLQKLPEHQRGDAVSSMVYEANARVRDPVYGCVGAIASLQNQVSLLQMQLAVAQAEVIPLMGFRWAVAVVLWVSELSRCPNLVPFSVLSSCLFWPPCLNTMLEKQMYRDTILPSNENSIGAALEFFTAFLSGMIE
ncbi:LOB domain-containing protein 11-like [Nicotiana sylvestris]|uniref:LOB domain-containing protein 11-like n=1 Tax=Nicotiana sylvestris TaxID=4096 RepID=UPI00388CC64E